MFLQPSVASWVAHHFQGLFCFSKIRYKTSLVEADSHFSQAFLLLLLCHCQIRLIGVLTLLYSYGYHPCGSTRLSIWFPAWNFGHQLPYSLPFAVLCPLASCWSFRSYADESCSEYPCPQLQNIWVLDTTSLCTILPHSPLLSGQFFRFQLPPMFKAYLALILAPAPIICARSCSCFKFGLSLFVPLNYWLLFHDIIFI